MATTHASFIISHNQHKAGSLSHIRATRRIQRPETRPVLIQTVDQIPLVADALALRDHNPDFLGNGRRKQPRRLLGVFAETLQLERLERRRPHGRGRSVYGWGVDAIHAVVEELGPAQWAPVVRCASFFLVGILGGVHVAESAHEATKAADEARDGGVKIGGGGSAGGGRDGTGG